MTSLRTARAGITAVWLFSHLGALAFAPLAMWLGTPAAAVCVCPDGDGASCPMHAPPASAPGHTCRVCSADATAPVALQTRVTVTTPPLIGVRLDPPAAIAPLLARGSDAAPQFVVHPEAPPPRL
jgi:hypothetical protein